MDERTFPEFGRPTRMAHNATQHNVWDVAVIQDSNQVQANWKLGNVLEAYQGDDGRVQKVEVQYKNPTPGEPVSKYQGRGHVTIQ